MGRFLFLLALAFLGIHGQGNNTGISSEIVRIRVVREIWPHGMKFDDSKTCDQIEAEKSNSAPKVIPVKPVQNANEIDDDSKQFFFKTAKTIFDLIPVASTVFGFITPAVEIFLGSDSSTVRIIQQGFKEISSQLSSDISRLEKAIELGPVKKISLDAQRLVQLHAEIEQHKERDPGNVTITAFLDECRKVQPYNLVVDMNPEMERVLHLQWNTDVYRSKTGLQHMKNMMNSILAQLSFVVISEQALLAGKNREFQIKRLETKLREISDKTDKVMKDLLNWDYWSNLGKLVSKVLEGRGDYHRQDNANHLLSYLQDIHTTDKFCVIIHRRGIHSGPYGFSAHTQYGNIFQGEEHGDKVVIFRSRTIYKMTFGQFMQKGRAVEQGARGKYCNHVSHRVHDIAYGHNVGYIMTKTPSNARKACGCFMEQQFTGICEGIIYNDYENFQMIPF